MSGTGGAEGWARGTAAVDYEARVDMAALRAGRLVRARRALADANLDAVLVWKDENVRYLTSLRPQLIAGKSGLLNGALLPREGGPILFVSGGDRDRAQATMPWVEEFHAIPILEEPGLVHHFASAIVPGVLARHGLPRARIGLDLTSKLLGDQLAASCPGVRWVDGDAAMQAARRIKTGEELAVLEEATALAEAVTATALAHIRPGVRECEVAGEALRTLLRLGGEYAHVTTPFVASGERLAPPTRLATDKLIRDGDLVFVDIGAMWNGYFGDIGRTVVCGTPSAEQRRVYRAVWEGLQAGIAAMRPGATNMEVARAIHDRAAAHGLREHFLSLFIGHGIGCGSNEPPYIGEIFPGAASVTLEAGMVFALEPLIWLPGVRGGGGVRLEDMVAVTETGARCLSRSPYAAELLA
ncbi:MAG TPA: Xaa-Pro peptidase family protein [bacterium]|nr:Xaa-Pro peptidase family protein [bacterium]